MSGGEISRGSDRCRALRSNPAAVAKPLENRAPVITGKGALAVLSAGLVVAGIGYSVALLIAKQLDFVRGIGRLTWLASPAALFGSGLCIVGMCALNWAPDTRGWRLVRWSLLPLTGVAAAAFTFGAMVASMPLNMTIDAALFFVFALLSTILPGTVSPRFGRTIATLAGATMLWLGWPLAPRFAVSGTERTRKPICGLVGGVVLGVSAVAAFSRRRRAEVLHS